MSTDSKGNMYHQISCNCTQYQSVYAYCLQHCSSTVKIQVKLSYHFGGIGELIFCRFLVFCSFPVYFYSHVSVFNPFHAGGFFNNSKCRGKVRTCLGNSYCNQMVTA